MSGLGIGRRNGGWLRVVGMEGVGTVGWDDMSPILGMLMVRAQWAMWSSVLEVVMVAYVGWNFAMRGRRKSQWSCGEFVGMNLGVWGSPM